MAMPAFVQKSSENQSINYFSNGIRKGASIQVMPVYNLQASQAQDKNWRNPGSGYGDGVIDGANVTYRITPCKGDIDYTQDTYPIATTGTFTSTATLTTLGSSVSVPFTNNIQANRAVQQIQLDGYKPAILFDVARGIGMKVTGLTAGILTTVTAKLTGLDFYSNPLVANIVYNTSAAGLPSPFTGNPAGLAVGYTNCAFSMLTEPPLITLTGDAGAAATVQFFAANFFGLPYYLAGRGHVSGFSQYSTQLQTISTTAASSQGVESTVLGEEGMYPGAYASTYNPGSAGAIRFFPSQTATPYFMTAKYTDGLGPQYKNYGLVPGYDVTLVSGMPPLPVPPSAQSFDVRGLFAPNCQWHTSYTYAGGLVTGSSEVVGDTYGFGGSITIQYYTPGIDFLQNVQKNVLQIYNVDPTTWSGFGKSNLGVLNPTQIPGLKEELGVVPYSGGSA